MKFHSQALRLVIIFKPETKVLSADGTPFPKPGIKVAFEDGHFETNDESIITLLKAHKDFGSKIFSDEAAPRALASETRGAEPAHLVQEFTGSRITGSKVTQGSDDPARVEAQEAQRKAMIEMGKLFGQEMIKEMLPSIKEQLRAEIKAEMETAKTVVAVSETIIPTNEDVPNVVVDTKKKK